MQKLRHNLVGAILTALFAIHCGGRTENANNTESGITGSGETATPPVVNSITPANNATGANRDVAIQITFSVVVNTASVTMTSNTTCSGSIQLSTDSNFGTCIAMNQNVTQSGTQITVRTGSLMAATTQHYIRITTAVAGTTGLTMQTQYNSTFTTNTTVTPLTNEAGACTAGGDTISAFKTAATTTEGAVGPHQISGLVVTGIDRFGSFYLQKGTDAIYVDVNTSAGACGGSNCSGNKASHYGLAVGDEICLRITRGVESNNVDTVKDFDEIQKSGIGSVSPLVLTDVFTTAEISRWVRISGYLTTKTSGGNVNHTLTFGDGKTLTLRDNSSNKFSTISQNDYIEVTSVASWFSTTPQIMIDSGVGGVGAGGTAPSYSVSGTISGWRSGENFTLTLNGANATVISANGAFTFTGSPTVTGQYTVTISVNPANDVCVLGNATGYATSNISSVTVTCTPKPMYQLTSWADSEAAGTYPLAMQLFKKSGAGSDETALVTVDAPYTLAYSLAYNLTSGARIVGKGDDGISFFNSGSTVDTYLGTAVLTLDTIGKTAMRLNWRGRSITSLDRPYRIAVQTRVGTSGAWANTGSFYAANATSGHTQTFSDVDISAIDNQLQGQVRFVYYQEGAGSGSRPELALDDVVVYSTSNAKPWLTAFSPAVSATGIAVAPSVSVTFNKAMNTATVTTSNLYIVAGTNCSNTAITATITASNSDRTFTFSPTGLSGSTQYSTCVKAAIADTTGDTLGTDRVISWTTAVVDVTAPTISSTTPANSATGVAVGSTIAVTFNEAMNAGTVTAQTAAGVCTGSVQVSSQASNFASCIAMTAAAPTFSGGNTVATFTPASSLTTSTTYLIRVTTAVQDASNNALGTQFTTANGFTTAAADVTAPTISSTTPANAATGISTSSTVAVTFSEAMSTGTVTAQTSAGACSGSVQVSLDNFANCIAMTASAPTFSGGNTVATFTPASALTASTTYKMRVTTAVQDASSNALASQFETATGFTTGAGGGTATDLFILGYMEGGTGTNKCIELFNGTGATINTSTMYRLSSGVNGAALSATLALTLNLTNNSTYVICNASTDAAVTRDLNSGFANFTGNDAIVLQKDSGSGFVTIDTIGVVGINPGTCWDLPSGANNASQNDGACTADTALTRKPTVVSPKATWDPTEWNLAITNSLGEIQTNSGMGAHTFTP